VRNKQGRRFQIYQFNKNGKYFFTLKYFSKLVKIKGKENLDDH
jgi:hypothetical protein